ncbi:fibronectin type III domain-containing protein [Chryseobacterium sp. CT-SW4]|uniref:fibronectin type III domain-containing protein n=1 Tax=Chryseobacterium sp. SW-1 TaxID=3157343 RepID=UPI003B022E92
MIKRSTFFTFLLLLNASFLHSQAPVSLPYTQDFSTGNDLTLVNGSQENQWVYGSATGNTPNALYISSDGINNSYTSNSNSIVHAYIDLDIPAGSSIANFSFDWKAKGENSYDYLRVWMVPSSFTPVAGDEITTGGGKIKIGNNYSLQTSWQTYLNTNLDISSFAGSTLRLVFEWTNDDYYNSQPPAAIDNISFSIPSCIFPSSLSVTGITATSATLNWTAPTPAPSNGYAYYIATTNTPPTSSTIPTGTVTTTSVTPPSLSQGTAYYWWVKSVCSSTESSIWVAGPDFILPQIPATLPYNQDFTSENDLTLLNGNQVNKWIYGSATGNPAGSLYISDNGTDNTYTINSASVVHAYRDISIPAGTTFSRLSFNWLAQGENYYDYLRVWLVPVTFNPTPGTQISTGGGRIKIGNSYNLKNSWQTYLNDNLDISSFAGSTMRLVFEWRNDNIAGTQPPAAVDNISLSIPSCVVPSSLSVTNITDNSATFTWTAPTPSPASGYAYYISTTNIPPTATTLPTGTSATNSVNIGSLNSGTTYYWWVKSVCSSTNSTIWTPGPTFLTPQLPATLPYNQDFTSENDLTFLNGNYTNQWIYGSGAGNPPNSIYISNNGSDNSYNTSSSSTVHAYRDIIIPPGTSIVKLSFDWKARGESNFDYLRVWLTPVTYTPSGNSITSGGGRIKVGNNFNQQANWQTYSNSSLDISSFAGSTMRLIFEWRNDYALGAQPPAAVDNISLTIPSCIIPSALSFGNITSASATLSWNAPSPPPASGYSYYISTDNIPPTATTPATGTTPTTSVSLNSLNPNTIYYWWVKSICSSTDNSVWTAGPGFQTLQIPATIPYEQDFTNENDFTLSNGTQKNKWAYGSATGNTPASLYISNNNGNSNTYSTSYSSVIHTYRDINIPSGTSIVTLSFDWKARGDNYDYLRVWLVPVGFIPTPGTQITAAGGRIQVGGNYNQQSSWQTYLNTNLDVSSFAGSTMRLVFEWRNNGYGGTQPPAAIDNIRLFKCSNETPLSTVDNITHNTAIINWSQDTGGANYIIRYRPVGTTTWLTVNIPASPPGSHSYILPNLLPATLYEAEVAAVCNNMEGLYSHNEFETRCDPTPPNVTVSNITTTTALVTWAPLAASSTYVLRYREVGTTTWTEVNNLPAPPANSYTIQSLAPYTTYEVQVANKCINETTINPYSNVKVFTTERTCELPPPGLTITNITPTTAVVEWDPFPGATYILRYRKVGIPSWTNIAVSTNTHTLIGLTELTKYEMQVVNVCNGTPGTYTEPYYFTTPTVIYCQMSSTNSASEYISNVTVKPNGKPEMSNDSGANNYSDFTNDPAAFIELVQGSTNNEISITKSWVGNNENEGVAVWIDFDRNGYFDIDERILVSSPNTTTPVTGTFSVPADAFISMTDYKYVVMRVAVQKGKIPVNCTSFDNGEVEDYTVRISKQPISNPLDQTQILIYPNPVRSVLNVKNISARANYKLYNATGQLISTGIILNNKMNVGQLAQGLYLLDIEDGEQTIQKKFLKE